MKKTAKFESGEVQRYFRHIASQLVSPFSIIFCWGLVVSVFSHFLFAWFLLVFPQWVFSRRIPKVQRNANLVDIKKLMLQNAPFLAIVAVDTEENEPSKVRQLDN